MNIMQISLMLHGIRKNKVKNMVTNLNTIYWRNIQILVIRQG